MYIGCALELPELKVTWNLFCQLTGRSLHYPQVCLKHEQQKLSGGQSEVKNVCRSQWPDSTAQATQQWVTAQCLVTRGTSNLYKTQPVPEQHLSSCGARHFQVWEVAEGSGLQEAGSWGLRRLASSSGCIDNHKPSTGLVGETGPPHTGPCEPSHTTAQW